MTNKYFILHEDVDVFTSHGVLRINTLHDAFKAGQIDNSFKVAGFYKGEELQSSIINIQELKMNEACLVHLTADMVDSNDMIVYSKQTFVNDKDQIVEAYKINNPGEIIISLNGMVTIESVSHLSGEFKFYVIEVDSVMPAIYGSKILLFSIEDGDKNNPFFTELKKKSKGRPKKSQKE